MIGACGVKLDRKASCSGARQLVSMDSRNQPARASRRQNPPRLGQGEGAAVTENVAELGKPRGCDRGNPALHQQIHERIGPAAKFGRNNVPAQKCPGDIEGLLLM